MRAFACALLLCAVSASAQVPAGRSDADFFAGLRLAPEAPASVPGKAVDAGAPSLELRPLTVERRGDYYLVYKDAETRPEFAIRREGKAYFVIGPGGDGKFPAFSIGFQQPVTERCSLGFEHHNEGHPANDDAKDHRDAFLFTGSCAQRIPGTGLSVEAGAAAGPSYDTVRRGEREYDDHGLARGLILALTQELGRSGWAARAQYEYLTVPGEFSTRQLMLGLQYSGRDGAFSSAADARSRVGVAAGSVQPNGDRGAGHAGGEVFYERWISRSVSVEFDLTHEGDGVTTARSDACVQGRYNFELSEKWRAAAGAGPCAGVESAATRRGTELLGRVTFDLERAVAKRDWVGFRMTRTAPFSAGTAQDTDAFFITFKRDL